MPPLPPTDTPPNRTPGSTGRLIVISGPSGVGKGTLCKALLKQHPHWQWSVSATSRPPRDGETNGQHYHFYSPRDFQSQIAQGGFFEWAEYNGNLYGTPVMPVLDALQQGNTILMEIEVQGALQVKRRCPQANLLFITPPSMAVLKERLTGRGTDTALDIEHRLAISAKELTQQDAFDACFENNTIDACLAEIMAWLTNNP